MGLRTTITKKKAGNSFYWNFEKSVRELLNINDFETIEIEIKGFKK